jgi:hypothetical protein
MPPARTCDRDHKGDKLDRWERNSRSRRSRRAKEVHMGWPRRHEGDPNAGGRAAYANDHGRAGAFWR